MQIKIKKLNENAVIPTYSKQGDAGMDMVAVSKTEQKDFVEYDTGISVEIPEGYVGLTFPRSSLSKYSLVQANHVGVIDSNYRGSIRYRYKRVFHEQTTAFGNLTPNWGHIANDFEIGDKIGQLIIIPYPKIEFVEVDDLSETDRGDDGFGSTGK